jgi:hypothetical protein
MSSSQEAPALIQYACERCKTRFVLPPSSRKLSIAGKVRAFNMGIGRAFRFHEGLGAGYDTSRRQLLDKMDDEAYQSFVQSFRFCHECRQFVCNECWSTSRRSCLTCVAKSMTGTVRPRSPLAPAGPEIPRPVVSALQPVRKGRMRRDIALVALALAIVLVSLEAGILLVRAMPGGVASNPTANATASPTVSATDVPVATDTAMPTATDTLTPTPSATASASATPAPTCVPTARPVATGTPMPATPTPVPPLPTPEINCVVGNTSVLSYSVDCSWTNLGSFPPGVTVTWYLDALQPQSGTSGHWSIEASNPATGNNVQLKAARGAEVQWSAATPVGPQ